jgi:hypothetical protein
MDNKERISKKINEAVEPYCCVDWCILKEILKSTRNDPRFIVQLKCIEHFKWTESETAGHDIGWQQAQMEWVERGYAEAFAQFYDEELTAEQIYEMILNYLENKS